MAWESPLQIIYKLAFSDAALALYVVTFGSFLLFFFGKERLSKSSYAYVERIYLGSLLLLFGSIAYLFISFAFWQQLNPIWLMLCGLLFFAHPKTIKLLTGHQS